MLWLALLAGEALALQAGLTPSTEKVLPEAGVPNAPTIVVQAARGEWEGFQVVISDKAKATKVDVTISDLIGPDFTIASEHLVRYREHYLNITKPSPGSLTDHEREPGLYPDPLIPFIDPYNNVAIAAPFDLAANELATIFIDIEVPRNAEPGNYDGTVTVSAEDGSKVELELVLQVWDFEIPAERTIATAFHMSDRTVKRFHRDENEDEIVARYFLALHEHRIDPIYLESELEFSFDQKGQLLPIDWEKYDATLGPWLDGSRFPDGVGVNRFNVRWFRPGEGLGEYSEDEYRAAAAALAEHLEDKGWWSKAYTYAVDEPYLNGGDKTYQQIHHDAQRLFAASELWRGHILVTSPHDERIDGDIGIWSPVTTMYDSWFWGTPFAGRDFYPDRFDMGEELWFYVCNADFPPYAGYDIDSAIGHEARIVKWGSFYEGATGFLYWATNYWVDDDPWNQWADWDYFGEVFSRNGDGFLLYPGDHDEGTGSPDWLTMDGPVLSYRLKQIRDGLEDWEMLRLLVDLGGEDYARAQVAQVYSRFGDSMVENCATEGAYCPDDQPWTLDGTALLATRANIAAKIMFLIEPDQYPDPEATKEFQPTTEESGCQCRTTATPHWLLWAMLPLVWTRRRATM